MIPDLWPCRNAQNEDVALATPPLHSCADRRKKIVSFRRSGLPLNESCRISIPRESSDEDNDPEPGYAAQNLPTKQLVTFDASSIRLFESSCMVDFTCSCNFSFIGPRPIFWWCAQAEAESACTSSGYVVGLAAAIARISVDSFV
jgi:hypothetical protein